MGNSKVAAIYVDGNLVYSAPQGVLTPVNQAYTFILAGVCTPQCTQHWFKVVTVNGFIVSTYGPKNIYIIYYTTETIMTTSTYTTTLAITSTLYSTQVKTTSTSMSTTTFSSTSTSFSTSVTTVSTYYTPTSTSTSKYLGCLYLLQDDLNEDNDHQWYEHKDLLYDAHLNLNLNFHQHLSDHYPDRYLGDYKLLHYLNRYYANRNHNNPSHYCGVNN